MNITENAKNIIDNCRFCWMCRHVCPIGNATGLERNTARARAFGASMVVRGATELAEIADNLYECSLCGACTNNCVTGFDPKVFIQQFKTELAPEGLLPDYIRALLEKYMQSGNVYGEKIPKALEEIYRDTGDVFFLAGMDAMIKAPECVKTALSLLSHGGVTPAFSEKQDTGSALYFLIGKTEETRAAARSFASYVNRYQTVIVYDPIDLAFLRHECREWGIEIAAELISFNDYLLSLLKEGHLIVQKGDCVYTLQDHFAYARDLDDTVSARELIAAVGVSRDMLLCGKETNLAGHLIMAEYMPDVIRSVGEKRWENARNMECKTLVTESPAEYVCLKESCPEGYDVLSIEEMLLQNLRME